MVFFAGFALFALRFTDVYGKKKDLGFECICYQGKKIMADFFYVIHPFVLVTPLNNAMQ